jgi:hypothetical protein
MISKEVDKDHRNLVEHEAIKVVEESKSENLKSDNK